VIDEKHTIALQTLNNLNPKFVNLSKCVFKRKELGGKVGKKLVERLVEN